MKTSAESVRGKYFGQSKCDDLPLREGRGVAMSSAARFVLKRAYAKLSQERAEGRGPVGGRKGFEDFIRNVELEEREPLTDAERLLVLEALDSGREQFGLLATLVDNPVVNDIIIRSFDDVSAQCGRKNVQTDIQFPSHSAYVSFVENILRECGKSCTTATPVVDAALGKGIRICVTHESFSPPGSGPMMTVRISRHRDVNLDSLSSTGLAPVAVLDYLRLLTRSGQATILIAGEVGTGKTTLVRALASAIDQHEAILIIEDTHEILLQRSFVRTLITREANTEGAGRIPPAMAIRTGMRMAMNRLILGEMRDSEAAEAFIDVCASGHSGMSTIHARSARDAINRLELFLGRAQPGVGVATLRRQIASAVSVVVYLGVETSDGSRRVKEILELSPQGDGGLGFSPMWNYRGENRWTRGTGITNFSEIFRSQQFAFPAPGTDVHNSFASMHAADCLGGA